MENKHHGLNRGLYFINIQNYINKPLKELQNKEHFLKFSIWVFALLLAVVAINVILILEIVFCVVDKNKIIDNWAIQGSGNNDLEYIWRSQLINLVVQMIIPLGMLITLIMSLVKCYKQKSFKYISFLSTILIFYQSILGFMTLIKYAISRVNLVDSFQVSWVYILDFSMIFIYPVIWFFISRNVAIIRRIYLIAELNAARQQVQNNFGGGVDPFAGMMANQNNENQKSDSNQFDTNDAFYLRLKNLTRDQLNEIAKQLSISGFESMKDEELMKIIADIRNVQNVDSQEKEIKTEEQEKDNK